MFGYGYVTKGKPETTKRLMVTNKIPKQDYTFPHVRFSEKTIGPDPTTRLYRDRIAIVGPFKRGPELARIDSRSDFLELYGEDESAGSIAVQQAMLQGNTRFMVSRVIPSPTSASGSVELVPEGDISSEEAVVGENSSLAVSGYTTGLSYEVSFISSPRAKSGVSFNAIVQTKPKNSSDSSDVAFPETTLTDGTVYNYDGHGKLHVTVSEYVDLNEHWDGTSGESIYAPSAVTIAGGSTNLNSDELLANQIHLLEIDGDALATGEKAHLLVLKEAARPGLALSDGTDVIAEILSYAKQEGNKVKLFVKSLQASPASLVTAASLYVTNLDDTAPSGDTENYYVLSVDYEDKSELGLHPEFSTTSFNGSTSFMTLKNKDTTVNTNYNDIIFYQRDDATDTSLYREFATGVKIRFGGIPTGAAAGEADFAREYETLGSSYSLTEGASLFVDVFKFKVNIGATEDDVTEGALEQDTVASELLESLEDELLNNESASKLLGNTEVKSFFLPTSLSFESSFVGRQANRISYKLNRTVSDSTAEADIDDINFKDDSVSLFGKWQQFVGGEGGLQKARRYFYDRVGNPLVMIEAYVTGESGNDILVSLAPLGKGQFSLEVQYDNSLNQDLSLPTETYTISNESADIRTGEYPQTQTSNLIRAFFLPIVNNQGNKGLARRVFSAVPTRLAPPNPDQENLSDPRHPKFVGAQFTKGIPLQGGFTPDAHKNGRIPLRDFNNAITRLEEQDVTYVGLVGLHAGEPEYQGAINNALSQAENSSPFNGLRRVAVAAPPRLSKRQAEQLSGLYNSDRLAIVAGWSTFLGTAHLGINSTNPVGYYLGKLAAGSPHRSPSSFAGVNGILSVDTSARPDYLDALTRFGIEAIYFDNPSRSFKLLNGRSTSKSNIGKWIALRGIGDHIISNLYVNLSWARSMPNSDDLRNKVATSANAYLTQLVADGMIMNYIPSVVDGSNNTSNDIRRGVLNVKVTYTPFLPADILDVSIQREVTQLVSLG